MNQEHHHGAADRPYISCREVLDFIMAYLDNELSADQRHDFERHLRVCPSCVNYLESYKQTVLLGKSAMDPAADPALAQVPDALVAAVRAARKAR